MSALCQKRTHALRQTAARKACLCCLQCVASFKLIFSVSALLWGQRTAYQIAKIVDADDVVLRVLHRLIARQIGFAEDRCLTIECFIPVDEFDYLALRVENGTYGARAIIPLYVGRNADIVCPLLTKIVAVPPTCFTIPSTKLKLLFIFVAPKNTVGTALPSIVSVPSIFAGPRISDTDFNKVMAAFTFCISRAPTTPSG